MSAAVLVAAPAASAAGEFTVTVAGAPQCDTATGQWSVTYLVHAVENSEDTAVWGDESADMLVSWTPSGTIVPVAPAVNVGTPITAGLAGDFDIRVVLPPGHTGSTSLTLYATYPGSTPQLVSATAQTTVGTCTSGSAAPSQTGTVAPVGTGTTEGPGDQAAAATSSGPSALLLGGTAGILIALLIAVIILVRERRRAGATGGGGQARRR
jgi:hypothetical protein